MAVWAVRLTNGPGLLAGPPAPHPERDIFFISKPTTNQPNQTSNIGRASNSSTVRQSLKEAIKDQARTEREHRAKMATFNTTQGHTQENLMDKIRAFVNLSQVGPVINRATKERLYMQIAMASDKVALIDFIKVKPDNDALKMALMPPVSQGIYNERLPIKLDVNNVHELISIDKIKATIESVLEAGNRSRLITIKDGKIHQVTKKRTVIMKVNGQAFMDICVTMNAVIPVGDEKGKMNLYVRANCRLFRCNDCFVIGCHPKCTGKYCGRCGSNEHLTETCKRKTKFCKNYHKPGHQAKDAHCPKYLQEIAREIRKLDFPISYLEDHEQMSHLANK